MSNSFDKVKHIYCKWAQKNSGGGSFDPSKDKYEHTFDLKIYKTIIKCNNENDLYRVNNYFDLGLIVHKMISQGKKYEQGNAYCRGHERLPKKVRGLVKDCPNVLYYEITIEYE